MFPVNRMRRLRTPILNEILSEVHLSINDLIYPIFIDENIIKKTEIKTMPDIYKYPLSDLKNIVIELINLGIKSILLFGIPKNKDEYGSSSYDQNGIIQKSISILKNEPLIKDKILIIADLCLCEYTTHGHCGIISKKNNKFIVDNDKTLEVLKKIAISYAKSGVDIIAPSGMMDGTVKTIREELDNNGYSNIPIMNYSSKFNSSLYGPFRDAANSSYSFGDRSSYQMNFKNRNEALREIKQDIIEGVDFTIVKPGIFSLDIISEIKRKYNIPIVVYQVSGEYSMIKSASKNNYINEFKVFYESFISFKRAGANLIITYYAKEFAKYLNEKNGVL